MNEPAASRWMGELAEDVLLESYHEIRDPIYNVVGYLSVLKSANQLTLSAEQAQQYIEFALNYALRAQNVVDSVYQYLNEMKKDQ